MKYPVYEKYKDSGVEWLKGVHGNTARDTERSNGDL